MRIFLIGFMGCGKTIIGKNMAKYSHLNFIDLDDYIVKKEGMSIKKIFEKKGESFFRKLEEESLKEVCKKDNLVIATGGGTPCFFNNMEKILSSGKTVYLEMETEDLITRLENEKSERPLLKNKSSEELKDFITSTLLQRRGFYKQAEFIVKAKDITAGKIISLIS